MASVPDGKLPLDDDPDWTKGFDLLVRDARWANVVSRRRGSVNIPGAAMARGFIKLADGAVSNSPIADELDGFHCVVAAGGGRHVAFALNQ